jgi:hypothetical protein
VVHRNIEVSMAKILKFPGGKIVLPPKRGEDLRGFSLLPFWDLPKEWRSDKAELEARFDLAARIRIVRKTRARLMEALEAQRKQGRRGVYYYDVNAHLNTAVYLKAETAYLEAMEEQQWQERQEHVRKVIDSLPQRADALFDSMRGLMPAEPKAAS